MKYESILFEKKEGIAWIVLNRPDALNALNERLLLDIEGAILEAEGDDDIRVVVIRGEGRAFCAGADLKAIKELLKDREKFYSYIRLFHRVMKRIEELPKPVIACVHGFVLAGGLELAQACDIIVAAEDARIGDQHANFGLIPGGGNTVRIPRAIGRRRAKELILLGNWLSGKEACEWGLVNRAVPADKLIEETENIAKNLRDKSPVASRAIKMLLNRSLETDTETACELEIETAVRHFMSEDALEGIRAFEEKRAPKFKGK